MEKFKENHKLSSAEVELIVPSVFVQDDWKRHMSINLDSGLWQCFKSGNKGNFIQLYAYLEGLTYNQAESDILFKELQNPQEHLAIKKPPPPPKSTLEKELYLEAVTLNSHTHPSPLVQRAWVFLYGRGLFNLIRGDTTYYVSHDGRYKNRLIIPFIDDEEMFYFQARALQDEQPKYLNPSEGWPKPSHILYPYDEEAQELIVCEGPLDAISLQIQGVNATCTMGCSVSEIQVSLLKDFKGKIILGYDNDTAGKRGVNKFDYLRKLKRMADFSLCHPPSEVNDWNDAHIQGTNLKQFIASHTKKYDYDYLIHHLLTTL